MKFDHSRHPGAITSDPTFSNSFDINGGGLVTSDAAQTPAAADNPATPGAPAAVTSLALAGPAQSAASPGTTESSLFTTLVVTTGNVTIDLLLDSAAQATGAGSTFQEDLLQGASLLTQAISLRNAVTFDIKVEYNENGIGGGDSSGGPQGGSLVDYSDVHSALLANAAPGDTSFADLPSGSSIQGYTNIAVWDAQLKVLHAVDPNIPLPETDPYDGVVNFSNSIPSDVLVEVSMHEITHALGREFEGSFPDIFDFFRYTIPGAFLVEGVIPATPAYFSVDGGTSSIASYGVLSDPSDFVDSGTTQNDPFAEQYIAGVTPNTLSAIDLQQLDVLGFNTFSIACFARGTRILTAGGEVPVEALGVGDMVVTASGRPRPIRWIGHRHIDLTRHPRPEKARPIRVRPGTIADGVPRRDLYLSPDHAVLLDGMLIPVRLLANGVSIARDDRPKSVTWFHVELDEHDILLAEGVAAESYLDTGNRGMFENGDGPTQLHPDFHNDQARREAASCLPFVDTPDLVEPVWRRVADRAGVVGAGAGARLLVGGRVQRPFPCDSDRLAFVVPAGSSPARLISRAFVPAEIQPWVEDTRGLGLLVRGLTWLGGDGMEPVPLDHPALTQGWWQPEWHDGALVRWTNGDAVIPPPRDRHAAILEIAYARTPDWAAENMSRRAA